MQSLPSPALRPVVATSQGLIVVCGGILDGCPVSKCQVFSLNNEGRSALFVLELTVIAVEAGQAMLTLTFWPIILFELGQNVRLGQANR